MKLWKITVLISISLIAVCIAFGAATRLSYGKLSLIENDCMLDINGTISSAPILTEGNGLYEELKECTSIGDTADRLSEIIENKSTLIVLAKKTVPSEIQQQCMLTKLDIEKVYKGDEGLAGKSIWVYEPVVFIGYGKPNAYWCVESGYTPINCDNEYLLMLENIEYPKSKLLNEEQKNSYKITSMSAFGKYTVNDIFQESIPSESKYTYEATKYFEIMGGTSDDLKIYNLIKKRIITTFGN